MKTAEIKLRPCPFCGSPPALQSHRFGADLTDRWCVTCRKCGITIGWYFDRCYAVKRWNTRPKRVKDDVQ